MGNFTFLKAEWPALHKDVGNAESLAYPDSWRAAAALDAPYTTLKRRAFLEEL